MAKWTCRNCNCVETDRTKLDIDDLGNARHTKRCVANVSPQCWHSECTRPIANQHHQMCDKHHEEWCNSYLRAWGLKTKSPED